MALIRPVQVVMVVHGTCLIIAGLMLLAAATGPHPLLSRGAAQLAAALTVPMGLALLALPEYLRRHDSGWTVLLIIECLAFATTIVLYFPVLVGLGAAVSGTVALIAVRGRAD